MQILDEFNIRVEDIKVSTQRGIVRDLFIISKENNFCKKIEKILNKITN